MVEEKRDTKEGESNVAVVNDYHDSFFIHMPYKHDFATVFFFF